MGKWMTNGRVTDYHKQHVREAFYSLGKKCPGCGKPIVNHATKCLSCRGLDSRAKVEIVRDNRADISSSYMAGYFDAEGSLLAHWSRRSGTLSYEVQAVIVSMDLPILKEFSDRYGGRVIAKSQPNGKTIYRWARKGHAVYGIANDLEPLLVLKRAQAQKLVEFQCDHQPRRGRRVDRRLLSRLIGSMVSQKRNPMIESGLRDHAYLAGLIDGDGSVDPKRTASFLSLGTKYKSFADWVTGIYGGRIAHGANSTFRIVWSLSKYPELARDMAKYLVIKRKALLSHKGIEVIY